MKIVFKAQVLQKKTILNFSNWSLYIVYFKYPKNWKCLNKNVNVLEILSKGFQSSVIIEWFETWYYLIVVFS